MDIGEGLGGLDFATAAKIAGSRFYVMYGAVARLHRAIGQFMLDVHTREHGYTETYAPYMVSAACADTPSSLAKFEDQLFKLRDRDLYLIPTAEYPVTNYVREEILPLERLQRPLANYWTTRVGEDYTTPAGAIFGPKVMIINEQAGSGGDYMPWAFRRAKLGPLVGKHTWGSIGVHENVIEASWDALVDSLEAGMLRSRATAK